MLTLGGKLVPVVLQMFDHVRMSKAIWCVNYEVSLVLGN